MVQNVNENLATIKLHPGNGDFCFDKKQQNRARKEEVNRQPNHMRQMKNNNKLSGEAKFLKVCLVKYEKM